jgi:hypothetical protein
MATDLITQERLQSLLAYDPDTGEFRWRVDRTGGTKAGDRAGSFDSEGYLVMRVDGRYYRGHRLIWLYVHGQWPKHHLDHINGKPSDNRLSNLREATPAQNGFNRKLDPRNKAGYTGITWCTKSQKWRADIGENGRLIRLGRFRNLDDAIVARKAAERTHNAATYLRRKG